MQSFVPDEPTDSFVLTRAVKLRVIQLLIKKDRLFAHRLLLDDHVFSCAQKLQGLYIKKDLFANLLKVCEFYLI
jgi:hypothetical protein